MLSGWLHTSCLLGVAESDIQKLADFLKHVQATSFTDVAYQPREIQAVQVQFQPFHFLQTPRRKETTKHHVFPVVAASLPKIKGGKTKTSCVDFRFCAKPNEQSRSKGRFALRSFRSESGAGEVQHGPPSEAVAQRRQALPVHASGGSVRVP